MKRLFALLLAVLYLTSAIGATMREHYCMGEKISTSINHETHHRDACPKCGMKKQANKGCCKDVSTVIKTGEHSASDTKLVLASACEARLPANRYDCYGASSSLYYSTQVFQALHSGPPPLLYRCPLFIRIRNLRI